MSHAALSREVLRGAAAVAELRARVLAAPGQLAGLGKSVGLGLFGGAQIFKMREDGAQILKLNYGFKNVRGSRGQVCSWVLRKSALQTPCHP